MSGSPSSTLRFAEKRELILDGAARLQGGPVDLVLSDVEMPGMDGYEVAWALKARAATEHIPIIFVTALDREVDERTGFACGGVDYVVKPLRLPEVMARLEALTRQFDFRYTVHGLVSSNFMDLPTLPYQLAAAKALVEVCNAIGSGILVQHGGTIKIGLGEVLDEYKCNACVCKVFLCEARAGLKARQLCQITQPVIGDYVAAECRFDRHCPCLLDGSYSPHKQCVLVHFTRTLLMKGGSE